MKDKNKPRRKRHTAKARTQLYIKAFDQVYSSYLEIKSVNGTMSCAGFYNRLEKGVSSVTGGVHPCQSDLLADVELALKKVMKRVWSEEDTVPEASKEAVGKEFVHRKIYPLFAYMKAKAK